MPYSVLLFLPEYTPPDILQISKMFYNQIMLRHRLTVLLAGDIVCLALSLYLMAVIRFNVGAQGSLIWHQLGLFAFLFILWLIVLFIFDLYNIRRINPNPRTIGLIVAAMAVNGALGVALFYLAPNVGISPKTNLAILVGLSLILLILWRRIFYHLFATRFARNIALIGESHLLAHLADELRRNPHVGTISAIYTTPHGIPHTLKVDLIIADAVPARELLSLAETLHTEVLSLTEAYETIFAKIPVSLMTDERAIELLASRATPAGYFIERTIEIIVASLVLIISSPFLVVAIVARLIEDGKPIFIKQQRVGKNGKVFSIYKLRSMKALAPDGSAEESGATWAPKVDMRITPVGNILRKTHIDEVPQMLNIIRGDIALIGPRPERPEFVRELEAIIPYYYIRHTIRPGFTGWAQIKFRYARTIDDSREKFEYDLYYLKNKNPLLDIGIFIKTLQIIFTH